MVTGGYRRPFTNPFGKRETAIGIFHDVSAFAVTNSRVRSWGCSISAKVAEVAAEPLAQLGLAAFCIAWFAFKLPVEILTAALSILAITLTQMVLNKQNEREIDAHRRDVALHAKLDELVRATSKARDELAGIEVLEEEEIERLKKKPALRVIKSTRKASTKSKNSP